MAKSSSIFFCSSCGNEFAKWSGQCPACHEWNTLTESAPLLKPVKGSKNLSTRPSETISVKTALSSEKAHAFSTKIGELDRVLGPGITLGGVYLIAGQPGIGKSTLLTQLATIIDRPVLYVCSEESPSQVATRVRRLNSSPSDHIHLLSSSCVEEIASTTKDHPDSLLIVDSIQSVYSSQNPTTAGSPSQIRDCATLLIQAAKETNTPTIIVGHVTKDGDIAGPKMLEHMVDAVLEIEGDRRHFLRVLRTIKNRFGPTDETGIFRMDSTGLTEVKDPSSILLEGRLEKAPGSVLTMVMEGTRPLTVEIQALVVTSHIPVPRRVAKGINLNRLQLICAILEKHLHLPIGERDVFVNVIGGLDVRDPSADLGIALAIISSVKDTPLPDSSIAFGELGLLGEIRQTPFSVKMVKEAKTLGYQNLFEPNTHHHLRSISFSAKK